MQDEHEIGLIPSTVHGVLDYLSGAAMIAAPRLLGWSEPVTGFLTLMGAATLLYSLLTQYELGPLRVLPFRAHLALDVGSGLLFLFFALLLVNEPPAVRLALAGFGLFELAVAALSQGRPALAVDIEAPRRGRAW